jgi:hypothetical protein
LGISDSNCPIRPRATQPEVGASLAAETLRVRAALYGFAAPSKIQQTILGRRGIVAGLLIDGPAEFINTNVVGTYVLLEAALAIGAG